MRSSWHPTGTWVLLAPVLGLNLLGSSWVAVDGDAAFEAWRVARGGGEARAHHLWLTPLFEGVAALLPAVPTFAALQCLTALTGAITAVLLFRMLIEVVPRRTALLATLVWIACAAVWEHSRSAETGMVAPPFLLGAFLIARRRPHASALLLATSVLLSMNAALLVPAWLLRARKPRAAVLLGAAVAVPYALAAPTPNVIAWVLHTDMGPFSTSPVHALARLPIGLGRLGFPQSEGETLLKLTLQGHDVALPAAEMFAVARNLGFAFALAVLAALGWMRSGERAYHAALVAPTLAFGAVWLGSDPQFWLPIAPFLWILAAQALPRSSAPWLLALAALMLVTNRHSGAPTALDPQGDWRWQASARLAVTLGPAPLLIRPGAGRWASEYVRVYAPDVDVLDLLVGPPEDLRAAVIAARAEGRAVHVDGLEDRSAAGAWELLERYRGITRDDVRAATR